MEIFRKEVVERRGSRLFGEVALASPVSTWAVTWLIGAIVAAITVVLLTGSYARKEIVHGWLRPDKGLVRIISPRLGTVAAVHVVENQDVDKGDSLATLNLDTALSGGEGVFGTALAEIETQIAEREKLLPLTELRFEQEARELRSRIESAQTEVASLQAQRRLLDKRMRTANAALSRFELLANRDAASLNDVERHREIALSLRQSEQQLAQQIEIKQGEIANHQLRLEGAPIRRQTAMAELRAELSGLKGQLAQIAGQGSIVLKAPVDGRIAALPIAGGQSLRPQQLAVALLPRGGRLEAELFVPTRAAGFIRTEQAVRLQFDAFPYQRFGIVEGEIFSVSRTIFEPAELPVSLNVAGPVYRVLANIAAQHVDAYGERFPLQAGMTLSAYIIQEERRLWQVLLEPLLARISLAESPTDTPPAP